MVKPSPERRLLSAGATDVGRQRKHNEDSILVRGDMGLFCVADGMGGHNAGDVASKLVITSIANYFEATRVPDAASEVELGDEYAGLSRGARRITAAVAKANRDVHTISTTHHEHHGMGSTCVALHITDGAMSVAHVGDSRCYRLRAGQLVQLTRDHSLINDALEMKPDLTKEELARLPKNIITRALGMKENVKVDVKSEPILPGDIFLLCSDGLTGMVPVDEIRELITLTPDVRDACDLLIAEANERGGTDNISALLIQVTSEDEVSAPFPVRASDSMGSIAPIAPTASIAPASIAPSAPPKPRPSVPGLALPPPPPPVPRPSQPRLSASSPASAVSAISVVSAVNPGPPPPAPRPVEPWNPVAVPVGGAPAPVAAISAISGTPLASQPASVRPPSSGRPPVLEVLEEELEEEALNTTHDLMLLDPVEEAALFAANGGRALDLRGAWDGENVDTGVATCRRCNSELLPGNRFCVECGLRIGEANDSASD